MLQALVVVLVCDLFARTRARLLAASVAQLEEVQQERRRFRATFEQALEGILLVDDGLRVVDANPAACALLAQTQAELVQRSVTELVPALPGEAPVPGSLLPWGGATPTERGLLLPDGTQRLAEFSVASEVLPHLHLISFRDIDDRKRADESLRFLAEAGQILTNSLDYDQTLAAITHLAVPAMADWAAIDSIDPESRRLRRVAIAHVDPQKVQLAQELHEIHRPSLDQPTSAAKVIRTGVPELTARVTDEMLVRALAETPRSLALVRELGLVSSMVVPLPVRGAPWGAITFVAAESRRRFSDRDVAFAQELAHRAGSAIEAAQAQRDRARLADAERNALRESTAWLQALTEAMPQIVRTMDLQGQITYANGRWGEYTGLPMAEPWMTVVHPDDRDRAVAAVSEHMRALRSFSVEFRIRRHDGVYHWFLCLGHLVRSPLGAPTMWMGSWTDIEEQVRTRTLSERLYRLTSGLASAVTLTSVADRLCELAAEAAGADAVSLRLSTEDSGELVFPSKEGAGSLTAAAKVAVSVSRPLASGSGRALGTLTFAFAEPTSFSEDDRHLLTAVAEQGAVALDRARAYEAEAVALRKKDEFLAMLGHELRNPLAPILTATNVIRLRGEATERELGILDRQARHLVRLVDDLLDISRITSGKLT